MRSKLLLLALLLLSSCLTALAAGEEGTLEEPEEVLAVDDEVEADDLKDPSGEELEDELVPENWTEKNKLDSVNKFFHGRYYARTYNEINNMLVAKVNSRDREPNMKFAHEWLAELSSCKFGCFKGHLVDALKQFTALDSTINRCDRHSYAILFKNNEATRKVAQRVSPSEAKELRRIDRMVYLFMVEHAVYCLPRYSSIMKSIMAKRDFKEVLLYQEATMAKHRSKLAKRNEDDTSLLMKMKSSHICKNNADVAMEVIRRLAGEQSPDLQWLSKSLDERKGKLVVNKEKVRYLVAEYLVRPCELFSRELGSNVIQPAKFDVYALEPEDFADGGPMASLSEPALGQARYRFCKILAHYQDSLVDSLIRKIGSSD